MRVGDLSRAGARHRRGGVWQLFLYLPGQRDLGRPDASSGEDEIRHHELPLPQALGVLPTGHVTPPRLHGSLQRHRTGGPAVRRSIWRASGVGSTTTTAQAEEVGAVLARGRGPSCGAPSHKGPSGPHCAPKLGQAWASLSKPVPTRLRVRASGGRRLPHRPAWAGILGVLVSCLLEYKGRRDRRP